MNLEISTHKQDWLERSIYTNVLVRQDANGLRNIDVIGNSVKLNHPKRFGIDAVPAIANLYHHQEDLLELARNRHPNVASFYGMSEFVVNNKIIHKGKEVKAERRDVFAYYEMVSGEWLHKVIPTNTNISEISEDGGLGLLNGLFDGVNHYHKVGNLVHRDIKPSNIMLVEEDGQSRLVLMDHELCNRIGEPYYTDGAATLRYAPTEAILCRKNADIRTDIALLGGSIAELLCWDYVYGGEKLKPLKTKNLEGESFLTEDILELVANRYGEDVARVLSKSTAHEVEGRYNDVNELKFAFNEAYEKFLILREFMKGYEYQPFVNQGAPLPVAAAAD